MLPALSDWNIYIFLTRPQWHAIRQSLCSSSVSQNGQQYVNRFKANERHPSYVSGLLHENLFKNCLLKLFSFASHLKKKKKKNNEIRSIVAKFKSKKVNPTRLGFCRKWHTTGAGDVASTCTSCTSIGKNLWLSHHGTSGKERLRERLSDKVSPTAAILTAWCRLKSISIGRPL